MADKKILIIDHIEDIIENGEVVGKQCFDNAGATVKVKIGRGGHLKNKWDTLIAGRAYSFTMGEFKGFPFVEEFEEVKDVFIKEAQKQVEDKTTNTRDRSVCLSYSKDLVIGDKIDLANIFEWADKLYNYLISPPIIKKPPVAVADTTTEVSKTILIEKVEQPPTIETNDVDPAWLTETLKIIHWKETTALSWIKAQLKLAIPEGKLIEVLNRLDKDKLKVFIGHITAMAEMK